MTFEQVRWGGVHVLAVVARTLQQSGFVDVDLKKTEQVNTNVHAILERQPCHGKPSRVPSKTR